MIHLQARRRETERTERPPLHDCLAGQANDGEKPSTVDGDVLVE